MKVSRYINLTATITDPEVHKYFASIMSNFEENLAKAVWSTISYSGSSVQLEAPNKALKEKFPEKDFDLNVSIPLTDITWDISKRKVE